MIGLVLFPPFVVFCVIASYAACLEWKARRERAEEKATWLDKVEPRQRVAEVVRISEWKTFRARREEQGIA